LIDRQKNRLSNRVENIRWLTELPTNFTGVILANEVLDAMPVDVVILKNGHWQYSNVKISPNSSEENIQFSFCDGPLINEEILPKSLQAKNFANGYTTEIHLNAQGWIASLAKCIEKGALLTFDYGFPEHEYYHPQRHQGTLMGHFRHHAIQDPFFYPGLCDLTAHVEWSTLACVAHEANLTLLGYTNQASYLLDAGIGKLMLSAADPNDPIKFMPTSNALQKLLSEAEMGELFKVMCLGKNLPFTEGDLPGFQGRPRLL
jgi:SAM-dependent MidA family methyltransferase